MDFELSDEQVLLRDAARRMLETESPLTEVRRLSESETGFDPDMWRRGADLGWPVLALAETEGGAGGDLVDLAIVVEEHGRMANPAPLPSTALVALAAARYAAPPLRDKVLESIGGGSDTAAWAFAEPRSPWNLSGVGAVATKAAAGYRLAGTKTAVHGGVGARWLLVTALLDGVPANFLLDTRDTPVAVRSLATLDLTRPFAEITLDGITAAESVLLAGSDAGSIQHLLDLAAMLVCADGVGVGESLLRATVEYAKVRVQFGRPIGSFQAIKHKCANLRIWLQGSRVATYHAAMALAAGGSDASTATATAKAYVSEAINRMAGEALQVHGGIGMTWEHDLHLYYRRAKTDEVLSGDARLHRHRLCDHLSPASA